MPEIYVAYKPLVFPERINDPKRNRVTRSMLIERMEAEATTAFLQKAVIDRFEEALIKSGRDEFDTGEFEIEIPESTSSPSTSWARVYEKLSAYLEVRADDSRAATYNGVKKIEGMGYCLKVEDLKSHLEKLIEESTSKPLPSRSAKWPKKEKDEEYPTEIILPDINFNRITREGGIATLDAIRFIDGIKYGIIDPYKQELQRWFEENTGYNPPEKIPTKEIGHEEKTVEFERGSYGQVQLTRTETPEYKKVIDQLRAALETMMNRGTVQQFRYTLEEDIPHVNITSLSNFLKQETMEKNRLIKVGSRYNITPN